MTEPGNSDTPRKPIFDGHGPRYRTNGDPRRYTPRRDFAHNYPAMISSIIRAFNIDYWPELFQLSQRDSGLSDEDEVMRILTDTKDAYCRMLRHCCDDPFEKIEDLLQRVGWNELPTWAQRAWLAMLGTVMTGQLWAGIREETKIGEPPFGLDQLLQAGEAARRAIERTNSKTESASELRTMVRIARQAGHSFVEIHELVRDVELGRTAVAP